MVEVYVHDGEDSVDFRAEHNSGKPVSLEELNRIGVIYKYCPNIEQVDTIAREHHYKNRDTVNISPASFNNDMEALMEKLTVFYQEHLHEDEEIRYCLEGEGYFDLRGPHSEWIRCKVQQGDLLIVPAGIYHRFTLTRKNYIKALRLFQDEPKWQAINRPAGDTRDVRFKYLASLK